MKKLLAVALGLTLMLSAVGCSAPKENTSSSGKTQISIGMWPKEKDAERYAQYQDLKARFEEANPDVEIIPDNWSFSLETFLAKAASGNLPTLYEVYFTEGQRVINAGYCADLTDAVKKYGYETKLRIQLKGLLQKVRNTIWYPNPPIIWDCTSINRSLQRRDL